MTSSETSTLPKSYAILQSMQFTPRFSINAPSTLHHRSTKKFTSNSWSINGNFRFSQKKISKKLQNPKCSYLAPLERLFALSCIFLLKKFGEGQMFIVSLSSNSGNGSRM